MSEKQSFFYYQNIDGETVEMYIEEHTDNLILQVEGVGANLLEDGAQALIDSLSEWLKQKQEERIPPAVATN